MEDQEAIRLMKELIIEDEREEAFWRREYAQMTAAYAQMTAAYAQTTTVVQICDSTYREEQDLAPLLKKVKEITGKTYQMSTRGILNSWEECKDNCWEFTTVPFLCRIQHYSVYKTGYVTRKQRYLVETYRGDLVNEMMEFEDYCGEMQREGLLEGDSVTYLCTEKSVRMKQLGMEISDEALKMYFGVDKQDKNFNWLKFED